MIDRDNQDLPPYDVVLFEAQRQARAKEFAKAVKGLTRINMDDRRDPQDPWVMRGASYDLPNGQQVNVMRQGYFKKPESSTSALEVFSPWTEHIGIDKQRRRIRLGRHVALDVRPDIQWDDGDDDLEDELPQPSAAMQRAMDAWLEEKRRENFEISMDPNYRPAELISGQNISLVEVKLQRGPNWRTEHASTLVDKDTKLSNLAARRFAGEEVEERDYTIQEHEDLMRLLRSIKAGRIEPTNLPYEII